jgi:hypothetical protein
VRSVRCGQYGGCAYAHEAAWVGDAEELLGRLTKLANLKLNGRTLGRVRNRLNVHSALIGQVEKDYVGSASS